MLFFRRLKVRLAAMIVVAILTMGLLILLFGMYVINHGLKDQVFETLNATVKRTSRVVDNNLAVLNKFAETASQSGTLYEKVVGYTAGEVTASDLEEALLASLPYKVAPCHEEDIVSLFSPEGEHLLTVNDGQGEPSLPKFQQDDTSRLQNSFFLEDGRVVLASATMIDGGGSAPLAGFLLVERVSLRVEDELVDTTGLKPSGHVGISRQDENSNEVIVLKRGADGKGFRMESVPRDAAVLDNSGEAGYGTVEVYGAHKFIAYKELGVTGWGVFASEKRSEALALVDDGWRLGYLLMTGILIVGTLIAILIASGFVVPIERLRESARALGCGDMQSRATVGRMDAVEIAELATEFNGMADRLDNIYHDLEHKVEERTAELNELNEQLQELDQLKSEFVSIASHELRSPLSSMKMGIATVAKEMVGPLNDEQKALLEIADRNIDRLSKLTTNLLDLTRIESGQLDLEIAENDVNDIVKEVIAANRQTAADKGIEIRFSPADGGAVIESDHDRVLQLLQNLVANAVSFTDEGAISISVGMLDDYVEVKVSDTGIGISEEKLGGVFDKWSQAHFESRSDRRGTGLGLAISRGIVEAHGGTIRIDSVVDEGTTVTFTLGIRSDDDEETDTDS